jgi:hypothetical protein
MVSLPAVSVSRAAALGPALVAVPDDEPANAQAASDRTVAAARAATAAVRRTRARVITGFSSGAG